jgi:dihydrofolate reductase
MDSHVNHSAPHSRPLVVTENMTANGVIEFVDMWFDPGAHADEELAELQRQQMSAETALILGRNTFDEFRGYWADKTDDDTGSTEHLNRIAKHLVTSTLTNPGWQNTTVVPPASLVPTIQTLKSEGTGDLGITGSIQVVHAVLEADLVDELRLFIYPVLTGRGRNLVPAELPRLNLELTAHRQFASGVVFQSYSRSR